MLHRPVKSDFSERCGNPAYVSQPRRDFERIFCSTHVEALFGWNFARGSVVLVRFLHPLCRAPCGCELDQNSNSCKFSLDTTTHTNARAPENRVLDQLASNLRLAPDMFAPHAFQGCICWSLGAKASFTTDCTACCCAFTGSVCSLLNQLVLSLSV